MRVACPLSGDRFPDSLICRNVTQSSEEVRLQSGGPEALMRGNAYRSLRPGQRRAHDFNLAQRQFDFYLLARQ